MQGEASSAAAACQLLGLEEPHARFRELVESLPTLVWTCRGDGPCDYLSPQWVAYTGIPEQEQLGCAWLDQIHPDDRQRVIEEWTAQSLAGEAFDIEYRLRRHDGVHRWFKTRAVPYRDEQRRVAKWFGSSTEVQALHDAQEQLAAAARELEGRVQERTRELERVNHRLQETATRLAMGERIAHIGTWELDVASGEVSWSDELFAIMPLPIAAQGPSYRTQADIFLPESWERIRQAIAQAVTAAVPYEVDVDTVRPDGSVRHCIARGEPRRNEAGTVVRLIGTLQDVTTLVHERRQRDFAAERMRLATQAAGFGFWDWSVPDDRVTWDERRIELAGLPRAAAASRAWWSPTMASACRRRSLSTSGIRSTPPRSSVAAPDSAFRSCTVSCSGTAGGCVRSVRSVRARASKSGCRRRAVSDGGRELRTARAGAMRRAWTP